MDAVQHYFHTQLPDYLRSLPLPDTVQGYAELSQEEMLRLAPLVVFIFSMLLLVLMQLCGGSRKSTKTPINHTIKKDKPKVVDEIKAPKEGKAVAYCRCWKSKKVRLLAFA